VTAPENGGKAKKEDGGKPKITPGEIFGYALAVGLGGGLGIYLFLMFLGMGIVAFGIAKRQYPEVVLGMMLIIFAGLMASSSRKDSQGDGH
jgi:hypothetical protein